MTRPSPDPVAESAALFDAISHISAIHPRLDHYIAKLHQKVLLQQVVTDDKATHTLARIGEDVLHGFVCFRLGQLHPYETQEWYSTAQHALCASHMRTLFFCAAGVFRGPVKPGTTSIASLFNTFIGAFWIEHGFDASLTMIVDIYQDSFAAVSLALHSHEQKHGPLSSPSTAEQDPGSDFGPVQQAVIKVIYGLPPSVSERFALSSVETPPGHNGYTTALGTEFICILTATAIRRAYPDISVDILQALFGVIFHPQILDHITHRLVGGRTPSQGGHGLLYLWLGHLVKARNESLLEDFVQSVTIPMFAAARAIRYPFYHHRACLSKDPSLSTNISAAMQQLLLCWSELNYLEFYQPPVDLHTLFTNVPDLTNLVSGTRPMEDLRISVQAYEGKPALAAEQMEDAPEPSGAQQDCTHIIARGFEGANTKQLMRLATAFVKELPVEAEFIRLLADEGMPNGGAIIRVRVTDMRTLFHGGDEAAHPFEFEGLQIFLSTENTALKARFARRGREARELREQIYSRVKRATFIIRDIDYYRTILTEQDDPLLLRTTGARHLELFGRKMMVFRSDVDGRGYVKDTSVPSIPRCGVQFRPRRGGLPSCEPKLLFDEGDRQSVRDYNLSMEKGILKIICSVTLPQSFVDNLNAVHPQMFGIQGTWLFIPQAELSVHMLRIANRKASTIRVSSA